MSMRNNRIPGINKKKVEFSQVILHLIFIAVCACYILPFMMVITISLSNSQSVLAEGFKIFPESIDFTAYKMIFNDMSKIIQAYKVTIAFTLLHTALAVVLQATLAYPMSKNYFKQRNKLIWFVFFTMLFSAGMIPGYITNTKILGLGNNFWVYVLPGAVSAWNVMIIKTFYLLMMR